MHSHLLEDIGLCIVAATGLALIARLLRQPLLLAYIAAGIVIGPIGLKLINDRESIQVLAELGLAFLMFIVGLEIDVKKLLTAGRAAAATTTVQVIGCAGVGWLAAIGLGYAGMDAMYLGAAIMFSSTMIVVKLLADRGELNTLPGRITLAILLFQDVFAIIALAIQPSLGQAAPLGAIAFAIVKGLGLVAVALTVSRFVLPLLFGWVARVPEIVLLSAMSWCFLVCYGAIKLEFSIAMGALIAGVSISALPYSLDVVAKIRSLRDFFVTLFFVSLGMLLAMPTMGLIWHALALSLIVIISRFAFIWPMLRFVGYGNRVGVLSSMHLAQTSEFSLLIVLLGASKFDHVDDQLLSLVVIMMILTSTASTYLIQYSHPVARRMVRWLDGKSWREPIEREPAADRDDSHDASKPAHDHSATIMLVGCFRVGETLVDGLMKSNADFMVIDFNPVLHDKLAARGVKCLYGDISHADVLEHAGVDKAKVLVCSISDDFLRGINNRGLLEMLRRMNPSAAIIVTADSTAHALQLYGLGADYVVLPRVLAADDFMKVIHLACKNTLEDRRQRHKSELEARLTPDHR